MKTDNTWLNNLTPGQQLILFNFQKGYGGEPNLVMVISPEKYEQTFIVEDVCNYLQWSMLKNNGVSTFSNNVFCLPFKNVSKAFGDLYEVWESSGIETNGVSVREKINDLLERERRSKITSINFLVNVVDSFFFNPVFPWIFLTASIVLLLSPFCCRDGAADWTTVSGGYSFGCVTTYLAHKKNILGE